MVKKLPEPANVEEAKRYIDQLEIRFAESNNGLFAWEAARIAYEFELPISMGALRYFGNQASQVFKAIDGKQTMERALRLENVDKRRVQYEELLDPSDIKRALWSARSLMKLAENFTPPGRKTSTAVIAYLTNLLAPGRDRWMKDWYLRARKGKDQKGQVDFDDVTYHDPA